MVPESPGSIIISLWALDLIGFTDVETTMIPTLCRWVRLGRWLAFGSSVFSLIALASCSWLSGGATPEPRPTLPLATLPVSVAPRDVAERYPTELARVDRGRSVYEKLCTECHGEAGRGDGPRAAQLRIDPTDFTHREQRALVPPAWYFRAISNGVVGTAMLGWEGQLNEQQRWDVTFYTWSLASSSASIDEGEALYRRECAPCHGLDGLGRGPQSEQLPSPPLPLADPRILAGRSGEDLHAAAAGGVQAVPHDWSNELTADQIRTIIDYMWTFLYTP